MESTIYYLCSTEKLKLSSGLAQFIEKYCKSPGKKWRFE